MRWWFASAAAAAVVACVVPAAAEDAKVDRARLKRLATLPSTAAPRGWTYSLEPDGRVRASGDEDVRRDLAALRAATERDPKSAAGWMDLGAAYRRRNDAEHAKECVARAVAALRAETAARPDDGRALASLALALAAAGDDAGADEAARKSASAARDAWAGLAAQGDLLMLRTARETAGVPFAVAEDAQLWFARHEAHTAMFDVAKVDAADKCYAAAAAAIADAGATGPAAAAVFVRRRDVHGARLARALANEDAKSQAAIRDAADADERRALAALPDDPWAVLLTVLSDAMSPVPNAQGAKQVQPLGALPPDAKFRVETGLARLRQMAESADAPTSARALQAVACVDWFVRRDPAAAEAALRASVAKDPSLDSSWSARLLVVGSSRTSEDVLAVCREWLAAGRPTARKHMVLGLCLALSGDPGAGEEEWRAALALAPAAPDTNLGVASFLLRRSDEEADLREAAKLVAAARAGVAAAGEDADPTLAQQCDLVDAVSCGLSGDVAGAEAAVRRLRERAGDVPVAAEVLRALGK